MFCVCHALFSVYCSLVVKDWENGWPIGSLVCHVLLFLSLSGSGVVLDCIDSCSLPLSYLYSCAIIFLRFITNEKQSIFQRLFLKISSVCINFLTWKFSTIQNKNKKQEHIT